MEAMREFIGEYSLEAQDSPISYYYGQVISLGFIQAARIMGAEKPRLNLINNKKIFNKLCKDGFELVRNNATKAIQNKIIPEMEAHALAGTNPKAVAQHLKKKFGDANADWKRLARSEMSMAGDLSRRDEWKAWGVEKLEFRPKPGRLPDLQGPGRSLRLR